MLKNVILDIGNVCVDFCYQDFIGSFGFPKETEQRLCRATAENKAWDLGDAGAVTEEEMLEEFIRQDPGVEEQMRLIYRNFRGIIRERKETIPWISEMHNKGLRVYYLSNYPSKIDRECTDAMDFLQYMDGGILSYRVKLIKPQPEIYELLLSRYQLQANECLFIDDKAVNCETAEKLSMKAIQFTTFSEVKQKMAELGI